LPAPISAIAYTNKEIIYSLLFDIAAQTLRTIAADPRHLGWRWTNAASRSGGRTTGLTVGLATRP
jgi:hypothetical protein